MSLLQEKSDIYRQTLRADSVRLEALSNFGKIKYHKAGGIKQHQVVRADQSRNYAGAINIAGQLKAQADFIMKSEYLPLVEKTRLKQVERIQRGWSNAYKTPKKVQEQLDEIMGRISKLKREANDLSNNVADHHYVTNQKFQKIKG